MIKKNYPLVIFCFAYLILPLFAEEPEDKNALRKDWAIGGSIRIASIPFAAEGENTVGGFLPLLFYEGEHFFFRGLEGGYKHAFNNRWRVSALGRIHFLDIPKEYQNAVQGDNVDWGLQLRFIPLSWQHFDIELMSDWEGNFHSNLRARFLFKKDRFTFEPYAELKLKTKVKCFLELAFQMTETKEAIEVCATGPTGGWRTAGQPLLPWRRLSAFKASRIPSTINSPPSSTAIR
jgi:hypothetical protein